VYEGGNARRPKKEASCKGSGDRLKACQVDGPQGILHDGEVTILQRGILVTNERAI